MARLINPSLYAETLRGWRGANAQVWTFHVSHKRLALRVARQSSTNELLITGLSCEHMAGPFAWKNCDLEIVEDSSAEHEIPQRLIDRNSGFELRASISLWHATIPILDDPFEVLLK
jgi:hypothetical protein